MTRRRARPKAPEPPASHEHYAARTHPEYVVLEIGAELGALIVHTDPHMHGIEVEISPAGDDSARSHKEVLERTLAGRPAYTALFDRLPEGTYTLWTGGVATTRGVAVAGGEISELSWADPPAAR
jgi:hypothetical protein